ncbi:Lrp/AsnC family transcriptional regulator [Dokdonella sp.]|uniref:Lrp/AsnC family transcriptional regulator n=1 Tax=Dokdonella sp. TaxID=2291710 RepID=UPI0032630AC9
MLGSGRAAWPRMAALERVCCPQFPEDTHITTELDPLDRAILALVQRDARLSSESIGSHIGLSASAVQRRMARLRDDGVITAEIAIVDPKRVGRPLTIVVDIEVERERPELIAGLRRWIADQPAIQEAWYVTGDIDYILIVSAKDIDEYESLMTTMVEDNKNVKRFTTRVALGTLKRGLALPLTGSSA